MAFQLSTGLGLPTAEVLLRIAVAPARIAMAPVLSFFFDTVGERRALARAIAVHDDANHRSRARRGKKGAGRSEERTKKDRNLRAFSPRSA
jgi:hypothetical protein